MPFYICATMKHIQAMKLGERIWVNEKAPDEYVTKEHRSEFATRKMADECISSSDEIVIEEKKNARTRH